MYSALDVSKYIIKRCNETGYMIQEVPDTIKFLKEKHRIIGGRHYLQ